MRQSDRRREKETDRERQRERKRERKREREREGGGRAYTAIEELHLAALMATNGKYP